MTPASGSAFLLGCGIGRTGVVDAGEPAKGVVTGARLYFISRGQVIAVNRTDLSASPPEKVLDTLFEGPDREEFALGVTTELPPGVQTAVAQSIGGAEIHLSINADRLSDVGLMQLACTAIMLLGPINARTGVNVVGPSGTIRTVHTCTAIGGPRPR